MQYDEAMRRLSFAPPGRAALTNALEGSYRIDREIGRGGMATVYLAEDVKHGRQVAVRC